MNQIIQYHVEHFDLKEPKDIEKLQNLGNDGWVLEGISGPHYHERFVFSKKLTKESEGDQYVTSLSRRLCTPNVRRKKTGRQYDHKTNQTRNGKKRAHEK